MYYSFDQVRQNRSRCSVVLYSDASWVDRSLGGYIPEPDHPEPTRSEKSHMPPWEVAKQNIPPTSLWGEEGGVGTARE
jgi:hypothetical protein